ncbi:MAG: phosphate ABC transporter permease PstC [Rhodocyclaceae bacterium]
MSTSDTPHRDVRDQFFSWLTTGVALFVLVTMVGIVLALCYAAWPSIKAFNIGFLFTSEWNPPMDRYGALIPIYGTLVTSIIALIIAVPVSFGIALFLTELSPAWLRRPLGTAVELLAAIPSIVYGMWGLLVFAPLFAQYVQPLLASTLGKIPLIGALFSGAPLGIGLLCAGVILAIMIIPFIASVMRDVFEVTPAMVKESAYGLGCTTWEVVWNVVLPHSKTGVVGGVMLGLGRALGETMAVTFVIGNTNFLNSASLFMPGNSITSALANEFSEAAPGLHTAALMELGLLLFVITLIVLVISKLFLARLARSEGAKS